MSTVILEISQEFQPEVMNLGKPLREEREPAKKEAPGDRDSLIHVSVALTAASVPALAAVVTRAIRAKKHVALKVKGITVGGIKEETILQILENVSREG